MTIIAHSSVKETVQERLQVIWVWLLMMQTRARRAWLIMAGKGKIHYGASPLLSTDDCLMSQWRVAAALGGSAERAQILQKIHEWIEHNASEGRPSTTYNGYEDWAKEHFGHLSPDQIGRHVRALEAAGVLVTKRVGYSGPGKAYDQRKSYRIDYGRLNALVVALKRANSNAQMAKSKGKDGSVPKKTRDSKPQNDSKSPNQSLKSNAVPNLSTQVPPTKPGRGGRRAGAGRKAKDKGAVIEPSAASTGAEPETTPVEVSMGMTDAPDASLPSSAAPLSPGAALIERMEAVGLEAEKAADLIATYGDNRVRAVVHECERRTQPDSRKPVNHPAGWIIRELENDVFKLGESAAADHVPDSDSHAPTGDAERAERMRRETERLLAEACEQGV